MHYITRGGLEQLKKKLAQLKKKRIEISRKIEDAKNLGDLSENADYIKSKEEQALNEGKIKEVERTLAEAVLIKKKEKPTVVGVGSIVVISSGRKEFSYTIVGSEESDPSRGIISNESPLGKMLLGRKVGERIEVVSPGGKKTYTIKKIQ